MLINMNSTLHSNKPNKNNDTLVENFTNNVSLLQYICLIFNH